MKKLARLLRPLTHRRVYWSDARQCFIIPDYVPRWYYWHWWRRMRAAIAHREFG